MLRVSAGPVDHCTHIQRHMLGPGVPIGKAVALKNLHPVGADPKHSLRSMLRSVEHVRRFTLVHQAEKASSVESFAPAMVHIGENLVCMGYKHHHVEDGRVCHESCRNAPQHVGHRIVKAAVPGCKSCVVVSMLDGWQSAIVDRLGVVLLLSRCHKHVLHTLCLGMVHGFFHVRWYTCTAPPRETVPSLLSRWGSTTTSRAAPHRSSSAEPCILRLFSPVPDAGACTARTDGTASEIQTVSMQQTKLYKFSGSILYISNLRSDHVLENLNVET